MTFLCQIWRNLLLRYRAHENGPDVLSPAHINWEASQPICAALNHRCSLKGLHSSHNMKINTKSAAFVACFRNMMKMVRSFRLLVSGISGHSRPETHWNETHYSLVLNYLVCACPSRPKLRSLWFGLCHILAVISWEKTVLKPNTQYDLSGSLMYQINAGWYWGTLSSYKYDDDWNYVTLSLKKTLH